MGENNNNNFGDNRDNKWNENDFRDSNSLNGDDIDHTKENPLKKGSFYGAYLISIVSLAVASLLVSGGRFSLYDWQLGMLLLCIPYAVLGLIIWSVVRKSNRPVALGVLFGCATPLLVVFIVTGGCGLFLF